MRLGALRSRLSLIAQDATLFRGSLRCNLAPDADDDGADGAGEAGGGAGERGGGGAARATPRLGRSARGRRARPLALDGGLDLRSPGAART